MDLDLQNRAYDTDVERLNKQAALVERKRVDDAKLKQYEEAMRGYSAEQQARATAASGGGGK